MTNHCQIFLCLIIITCAHLKPLSFAHSLPLIMNSSEENHIIMENFMLESPEDDDQENIYFEPPKTNHHPRPVERFGPNHVILRQVHRLPYWRHHSSASYHEMELIPTSSTIKNSIHRRSPPLSIAPQPIYFPDSESYFEDILSSTNNVRPPPPSSSSTTRPQPQLHRFPPQRERVPDSSPILFRDPEKHEDNVHVTSVTTPDQISLEFHSLITTPSKSSKCDNQSVRVRGKCRRRVG